MNIELTDKETVFIEHCLKYWLIGDVTGTLDKKSLELYDEIIKKINNN
tara:strand:+ start:128 stop:271 length:144 start_codon:yes stop_codon:yes gene_type:complete